MKLKVKTKLRNEKDELQVDDVSPLFSTINEGIEEGNVNVTKLYRHDIRVYNSNNSLIGAFHCISTLSDKRETVNSVFALFRSVNTISIYLTFGGQKRNENTVLSMGEISPDATIYYIGGAGQIQSDSTLLGQTLDNTYVDEVTPL